MDRITLFISCIIVSALSCTFMAYPVAKKEKCIHIEPLELRLILSYATVCALSIVDSQNIV